MSDMKNLLMTNLNIGCPDRFVLEVGQSFGISLDENLSKGEQWELAQPLTLFETNKQYDNTQTELATIDMTGKTTFTFKAIRPGQEKIHLKYIQSTKKIRVPIHQWQCTVNVVAK